MLTLTHNYYDRHATINCNFKSLKILQIQQKRKDKRKKNIEMIVFYVWIKIKWNVFFIVISQFKMFFVESVCESFNLFVTI